MMQIHPSTLHARVEDDAADALPQAAAITSAATGVVVDLTDVPHIDRAGLRMFTRFAEQLDVRRQQLRLVLPRLTRPTHVRAHRARSP